MEDELTTYCMINDIHNFVVFKSNSVLLTELDDEGINKLTEYTNKKFADFVNANNIQFYDWEVDWKMEDNINDLLIKARDNISDNVDKQTEFNYRKALEESMKELQNLKTINQEFIDIRNVAIKNLYDIGYSAIELAEITNLTDKRSWLGNDN